ncbi:maltose ABC transporter substrate-binding protein [Paenibacillus odorifer]|jgi:arabinogalactan oligomer/maltooligosaccharide transport system substrate-binding protein|uniref:sugar ABC transporter substrate-binding protein n=1 Tax=Paenibacillus TaxID=44249 RepID=UPI0021165A45|nr:maltose ABC transporter substrate-binding protein [Paenibacillus odorifer]
MKKSKRSKMQAVTFSLVLCLLLTLTVTACGSGNGNSASKPNSSPNSAVNEPGGTTNETNTSGENTTDEEMKPEAGAKLMVWEAKEQLEYMKQIAADFEKEYGVPVTVEEMAGGDQGARLATDGPSKLAADVLTLPHDQIGQAVKAGLLLPNDVFEEETKSTMVATAVQASSYDGILYGYPKSVETYALFYNKDLIPEAPKTWDDVIAFADTYNNPKENKFAIMWEFVGYYSYPFIGSFGGYIYGDNNTNFKDIGLNNEGTIKGFTFLQSLKKILPLNAGDITYDVKTQLFQEGKLAMNIDGPWSIAAFKENVNLGVAPLPKGPDGQDSLSFSGVKSYYVNSYTEYPVAGRLFAHFASNKENQLKNFEMTGAIPASIEAGEAPEIKDDPIIGGFFEQFQNSVPMPSVSEIKSVWEPLKAAFVSLWNDSNLDVKQTLDQTVTTIQADLESK